MPRQCGSSRQSLFRILQIGHRADGYPKAVLRCTAQTDVVAAAERLGLDPLLLTMPKDLAAVLAASKPPARPDYERTGEVCGFR